MKLFSLIFLFSFITYGANAQQSVIEFQFPGIQQNIQLQIGEEKISLTPDIYGNAVVKRNISFPQYVKIIRGGIRPELLYIYPNDKLQVNITGTEYGKLTFNGKNSSINVYLTDQKINKRSNPTGNDEIEFINSMKSKVRERIDEMLSYNFDKEFSEKEKKRIAARIYTSMSRYKKFRNLTEPEYHPSNFYYEFIKEQLFEDEEMLLQDDYTDFVENTYQFLATKNVVENDKFREAMKTLEYVAENTKSKKIKYHLINYYTFNYLKPAVATEVEPVTVFYKKHIRDIESRNRYDKTVESLTKLKPGKLLPDLIFYDIEGRSVSLNSFKGKYVYIDVWATWCKPCLAEIPNMKKMEKALEGKNILFVSISTDKDGTAWERMVRKDNFSGIQLHSRTKDFSKELMIEGIPRFILIDPKGKIVDAHVSKPNQPETYQLMETLPGL